jgi:hypothetical protein
MTGLYENEINFDKFIRTNTKSKRLKKRLNKQQRKDE